MKGFSRVLRHDLNSFRLLRYSEGEMLNNVRDHFNEHRIAITDPCCDKVLPRTKLCGEAKHERYAMGVLFNG